MDRLLLIHELALKPLVDNFNFEVKGIDMCAQNLLNHDSELLDKVAEKLKARHYYTETEWGWSGYTVTDKDIDEVIAGMKAQIEKGEEQWQDI